MDENKNGGWRCPECDYLNNASAKTCGGCGRSHDDSNKLAYARLHTDEADLKAKNTTCYKILAGCGAVALAIILAGTISSKKPYEDVSKPVETTAATTRVPGVSYYTGDSTTTQPDTPKLSSGGWLKYGNLLDMYINDSGSLAVLKVKIDYASDKTATINQNYANIENFVLNHAGSIYDEIQYWAVADLPNGSEEKVISFTVSKDLIDSIADKSISGNDIGNYVDDLWLYSDLRDDSAPIQTVWTIPSETAETTQSTSTYSITSDSRALESALSYLNTNAFSRQGLKDQLEFEGFSAAEAEYAVDNCGADWYKEAALAAIMYMDSVGGFSADSLQEQLEYDGFTSSEAEYGVQNCGLDTSNSVLESAKLYIQMGGFSKESLIEQLEYEGFSHDDAVYGADNCGADWNEQAAMAADTYASIGITGSDLRDQLEYEGFTSSQIDYAMAN